MLHIALCCMVGRFLLVLEEQGWHPRLMFCQPSAFAGVLKHHHRFSIVDWSPCLGPIRALGRANTSALLSVTVLLALQLRLSVLPILRGGPFCAPRCILVYTCPLVGGVC